MDDDSKALMKIYLPAIEGHVPAKMVHTVCNLIKFSYLVHCDVHNTESIQAIDAALKSFHNNQEIFRMSGIIHHFNYPHQHSLKHYIAIIYAYGSPSSLCSSITENKHIKAIKNPWRHSNHYKAMKQMLLMDQHLDKLSASCTHFKSNNMLEGDCLTDTLAQLSKWISFNLFVYSTYWIYIGQLDQLEEEQVKDTDDIDVAEQHCRATAEDEDDKDEFDIDGPWVVAYVKLVRTIGASTSFLLSEGVC